MSPDPEMRPKEFDNSKAVTSQNDESKERIERILKQVDAEREEKRASRDLSLLPRPSPPGVTIQNVTTPAAGLPKESGSFAATFRNWLRGESTAPMSTNGHSKIVEVQPVVPRIQTSVEPKEVMKLHSATAGNVCSSLYFVLEFVLFA